MTHKDIFEVHVRSASTSLHVITHSSPGLKEMLLFLTTSYLCRNLLANRHDISERPVH